MSQLFDALLQAALSLWELFTALLAVIVPWSPLIAWIAFWLLAVNWVRLRETLAKGGWIGLALIAAVTVLIWGSVSPAGAPADFFGLQISNFVEKTVYVSGLVCLMFLAGAVQLSGAVACCAPFEQPILIAESHDQAHDHGGHH
ncbi:MAG: hypothetical protein ACT4QC_21530 [Planctomycetaceae bacterium]